MNKYGNSPPAVVLSLFDTGVYTARALGRLGIKVFGYDSSPDMPGFKSRYCQAKLCPDPVSQTAKLFEFLMKEVESMDYTILYPASDDFVLFVSRYRRLKILRSFFYALSRSSCLTVKFLYGVLQRVRTECITG